jgi:para-aminobenzoate synthetase/4-amino-4-deoxychorismate lyase
MPGDDPLVPAAETPGAGCVVLQEGRKTWLFRDPVRELAAYEPREVFEQLRALEHAVEQEGLYAVGFLTYEAAAAFGLAAHPRPSDALPLLWFGLYLEREEITLPPSAPGAYQVGNWQAALDEDAYSQIIAQIKEYIAAGETYQVNFTMPLQATFAGDPWALFCDLVQAQQANHVAYVDLGRYAICSASPELFFERQGSHVESRPMKGTARRGRTLAEDRDKRAALQASAKDRAENVMIVDMIRNDLGRVAEIGSVQVPELFSVERYPTLLQMTSTVTAETQATAVELLRAMFPCASITGAPKVRTMQIINELEQGPRGIYTGSIGYFAPGRRAAFNVAIRTVVVDREHGRAAYHVGSGIVWDSEAAQEYAECALKAEVLLQQHEPFSLLESLRWTPERGYFLLELHLQRLAASAEYFGFILSGAELAARLADAEVDFEMAQKVRLLLGRGGGVTIEAAPLQQMGTLRVTLARTAVGTDNIWLYHKTTRRAVYEQARAGAPGYDDVLLWNEGKFLTEATNANIVLRLDGRLLTPPIEAGLLAGTFRRYLLEQGQIEEYPLAVADLARCEEILLINSVRGWQRATFVEPSLSNSGR